MVPTQPDTEALCASMELGKCRPRGFSVTGRMGFMAPQFPSNPSKVARHQMEQSRCDQYKPTVVSSDQGGGGG